MGAIKTKKLEKVFIGTGRRKTASARVRLKPGSGKVSINGKDLESFCSTEQLIENIMAPLKTAELAEQMDVTVRVQGGGHYGQSGAIALGIARALQSMDQDLRPSLKAAGHLKRDPRMKERKKSGQPGARKRFQFSKR